MIDGNFTMTRVPTLNLLQHRAQAAKSQTQKMSRAMHVLRLSNTSARQFMPRDELALMVHIDDTLNEVRHFTSRMEEPSMGDHHGESVRRLVNFLMDAPVIGIEAQPEEENPLVAERDLLVNTLRDILRVELEDGVTEYHRRGKMAKLARGALLQLMEEIEL